MNEEIDVETSLGIDYWEAICHFNSDNICEPKDAKVDLGSRNHIFDSHGVDYDYLRV